MKKNLFLLLCVLSMLCSASENNSILISKETKKPNLSAGYYSCANGRSQEDALACCSLDDKKDFFAVYDGCKGANLAYCLALKMHDKFRSFTQQYSSIKEAFESTYAEMEEYALQNYSEGSAATTVCVDTDKKIIHVAWLGNSRVLLEQNKKKFFVTSDHYLDTNFGELDRLKKQGATIFRELTERIIHAGEWRVNCLNMTRCLGDPWAKGINSQPCTYKNQPFTEQGGLKVFLQLADDTIPDQVTIEPKKGQIIATPEYMRISYNKNNTWLIIASKNFWGVMSHEEAIDLAIQHNKENNSVIARLLVEAAQLKNSLGNISVIVVKLKEQWEDEWTEL